MTEFWKRWLNIWCWGVGLFGIGLASFAYAPTEGFTRLFFRLLGKPLLADPGEHMRFAMGLMGCITIGWAITFAAAFKAAHQLSGEAARGIWRLVTLAALVWYVIDSLVSIATRFPLNAVSNTVLIILFLVPVMRSGVLKP